MPKRLVFVIHKREFKEIYDKTQKFSNKELAFIFREKSLKTDKKLFCKKYELVEIRNGIAGNRPKILFKYRGYKEIENGYKIFLTERIEDENCEEFEFKLNRAY